MDPSYFLQSPLSAPTTLTILLFTLVAVWVYTSSSRTISGIPGPRPIPIIGNVFEMFQCEAVELMRKWINRYGRILQYKVFAIGTQVLVADADSLHRVLVSNAKNYVKPETLLVPCRTMFGPRCIICLPPAEHDACRALINPAFRMTSVRKLAGTIAAKTHILVSNWADAISAKRTHSYTKGNKEEGCDGITELTKLDRTGSTPIKVQEGLTFISLDILGSCMFGYEFNSLTEPNGELSGALHRMLSIQTFNALRFIPFYSYLPTQLNKDTQTIKRLVHDILQKKKQSYSERTNRNRSISGESQIGLTPMKKDMLDILLQSRAANDSPTGTKENTDLDGSEMEPRGKSLRIPAALLLPDSDIVDDIHQFLIAGHETVTNTLCFALLQLATYPDIQDRVRQEALEILPTTLLRPSEGDTENSALNQSEANRKLEKNESQHTGSRHRQTGEAQEKTISEQYFEACQHMTYTDCVLKETMRMFPAVPLTLRQSVHDDTLGGYHIPPGTVIALHVATVMRLPGYFADPDRFYPERFLPKHMSAPEAIPATHDASHHSSIQPQPTMPPSEATSLSTPSEAEQLSSRVPEETPLVTNRAFLPFLAGPEMCVGHKFAMVEMKVILGMILQRFRVDTIEGREFKGRQGLTYHVHPSLELNLTLLDNGR